MSGHEPQRLPARWGPRSRGCPCISATMSLPLLGQLASRDNHFRRLPQCLIDHAVAFRQAQQSAQFLFGGISIRAKWRRTLANPTCASLATPNVPRKSRSPSARTTASRITTPIAVATAPRVTPAQATNASSSISPEQAVRPSSPVAGCNPAVTRAFAVCTLHVTPSPSRPSAFNVMRARRAPFYTVLLRGPGWHAVLRSSSAMLALIFDQFSCPE